MKKLKISKGVNHQKPKVYPQKQKPKPLLYAVRIMVLAFFGKQDPITWLLLPFHLSTIQSILISRIWKKKSNQIKKSHKQFWNLTHKKTEREKGREMWSKRKEEKMKRRKGAQKKNG